MRWLLWLCWIVPVVANAQVFRCEIEGRTVYQPEACPQGVDGRVVEDRISVVESRPGRPAPQYSQQRATQVRAPSVTQGEHARCPELRAQIRRIDAQARQRSTQALTDRRRNAVRDLESLRCSRFD